MNWEGTGRCLSAQSAAYWSTSSQYNPRETSGHRSNPITPTNNKANHHSDDIDSSEDVEAQQEKFNLMWKIKSQKLFMVV
eukprot:UN05084